MPLKSILSQNLRSKTAVLAVQKERLKQNRLHKNNPFATKYPCGGTF